MSIWSTILLALGLTLVGGPALAQPEKPAVEKRRIKKKKTKRKVKRKGERREMRKATRKIRRKKAHGDPKASRAWHTRISVRKTTRIIRDAHQQVKAGKGEGKAELASAVRKQVAARKAFIAGRYGAASALTFKARDLAWAAGKASGVAPIIEEKPEIYPEVGVDEPLKPMADEKPEEAEEYEKGVELPTEVDDAVIAGLDLPEEPAPTPAKPEGSVGE